MEQHPIHDIITDTVEKMRQLVDSNTVIGSPIKVGDDTTILPVSKVTFGFVSGGSDFATQKQKDLFGGAASTGASITPTGFLVIRGSSVRLIQMADGGAALDRVLNMVPDVMDRIDGIVGKGSKGGKVADRINSENIADIVKEAQEVKTAEAEEEKKKD
ncbi:MAG: sporulation protein YtfJ [Oscillospiraceae bacterium]|nr:sporulation protein YtfJ [Oscillospiraceae bacterium]